MPTPTLDLASLAAQLTALSNDDAATLLDAISGLTERAQKAREERARAEAERDACTLVCTCGKPVARYRWLECVENDVRLGTYHNYNRPLRGGYIADCDSRDSGVHIPSAHPVFKTAWFKCDDAACKDWVEAPTDRDYLIGWE